VIKTRQPRFNRFPIPIKFWVSCFESRIETLDVLFWLLLLVPVDGIKETGDVCIEHPIYIPTSHGNADRIQRIVWTASWSKAVEDQNKTTKV